MMGREIWGVTTDGYEAAFWGEEHVLNLGSGDGHTTLSVYEELLNYIAQKGECYMNYILIKLVFFKKL